MNAARSRQLAEEHGTPLLMVSEKQIRESYNALKSALPGVDLYYAVKSNPVDGIIDILRREGSFFDVSTNGEIDIVRSQGISGERCIHTHPIKRDGDIRYALEFGIQMFVVDNEHELSKFVPYKNQARLLVRLSVENPQCLVNLSHKFGIAPQKAPDLIKSAHAMGLSVQGISFHCGSQNETSLKYIEALEYCRDICRIAALSGITLETIDIGGGFPIDYLSPVQPIVRYCQPVNEYLERYFSGYRIIAEPGRFISGPSTTLATRVIGISVRNGVRWYYIDEGMYGSFSGKMYDHADYPMIVGRKGKRHTSTISGPTCDSIDVLYENIALPELHIGDVLIFNAMGAYTNASASTFNGFTKAKTIMVA